MVEAVVGLALGAAMIAAGIILPVIGLAIAGFVVMLLCGIWALNTWRQMTTVVLSAVQDGSAGPTTGKRRSRRSRRKRSAGGTFGERIDERWRRRQEGGY